MQKNIINLNKDLHTISVVQILEMLLLFLSSFGHLQLDFTLSVIGVSVWSWHACLWDYMWLELGRQFSAVMR